MYTFPNLQIYFKNNLIFFKINSQLPLSFLKHQLTGCKFNTIFLITNIFYNLFLNDLVFICKALIYCELFFNKLCLLTVKN